LTRTLLRLCSTLQEKVDNGGLTPFFPGAFLFARVSESFEKDEMKIRSKK
jgi:hypothetical protein